MNERNFDFSTLSERISAQTEAAVEFSNALVRIIEQTAAIRDRIHDSNSLMKDELKTIGTKVQDILSEYNKFNSDNNNKHDLFEKDLDSLREKIISYEKQLQDLLESSETNSSILNSYLIDSAKYSKQTLEQMSTNHYNNMQEFIKLNEANIKFMHDVNKQIVSHNDFVGSINTQLKSIDESIHGIKKDFNLAKNLFLILSGVSTVVGLLSALNILKISWFIK